MPICIMWWSVLEVLLPCNPQPWQGCCTAQQVSLLVILCKIWACMHQPVDLLHTQRSGCGSTEIQIALVNF